MSEWENKTVQGQCATPCTALANSYDYENIKQCHVFCRKINKIPPNSAHLHCAFLWYATGKTKPQDKTCTIFDLYNFMYFVV